MVARESPQSAVAASNTRLEQTRRSCLSKAVKRHVAFHLGIEWLKLQL